MEVAQLVFERVVREFENRTRTKLDLAQVSFDFGLPGCNKDVIYKCYPKIQAAAGHVFEIAKVGHDRIQLEPLYAIKIVYQDRVIGESDEIRIMELAGNHENLIPLLASHQNKRFRYLIMPICEFDLYEYCMTRSDHIGITKPILAMEDIREIIYQTAQALLHLHDRGIVHIDVKPENLLLSSRMDRVMLCDYNLSLVMDEYPTRPTKERGTRPFTAPECMGIGGKRIDARADVWSLGMLAFSLASNLYVENSYQSMTDSHYRRCVLYVGDDDDEFLDFMERTLKIEASERMSDMRTVLHHPWLCKRQAQTRWTLP